MQIPTDEIVRRARIRGRLHPVRRRVVKQDELGKSHYYQDRKTGVWYKSCPECSRKACELVWHVYEAFTERVMEDGAILPQSWCSDCRRGS